jgi:hypothetical protein
MSSWDLLRAQLIAYLLTTTGPPSEPSVNTTGPADVSASELTTVSSPFSIVVVVVVPLENVHVPTLAYSSDQLESVEHELLSVAKTTPVVSLLEVVASHDSELWLESLVEEHWFSVSI